jgi:hypothetical protein
MGKQQKAIFSSISRVDPIIRVPKAPVGRYGRKTMFPDRMAGEKLGVKT